MTCDRFRPSSLIRSIGSLRHSPPSSKRPPSLSPRPPPSMTACPPVPWCGLLGMERQERDQASGRQRDGRLGESGHVRGSEVRYANRRRRGRGVSSHPGSASLPARGLDGGRSCPSATGHVFSMALMRRGLFPGIFHRSPRPSSDWWDGRRSNGAESPAPATPGPASKQECRKKSRATPCLSTSRRGYACRLRIGGGP